MHFRIISYYENNKGIFSIAHEATHDQVKIKKYWQLQIYCYLAIIESILFDYV